MDPFGLWQKIDLIWGRFSVIFGTSETDQGPTGQIGAQKDESGPGRRIRACKTNQGPRDMALQEESGPARQVTAWQDEPGIHGTNTGPARRIRTPQDKSGPRGRITTAGNGSGPRDESELRRTNQGPARWARDLQDEYGRFGTDKGSTRHQSGPHGTNHSLVGQTRVPRDQSGSAGQIRALRAESGPRKTNQGPADGSWSHATKSWF